MRLALVLMNTDPGAEKTALQKLKQVEGVSETYLTYGSYDIIVKVEADSEQKVKEIIFSQLRKIEEVRSTLTLVVAQ